MPEYYFDVETYSPAERPDPMNDKIITIQYQRLSTERGQPEEPLNILTEWNYGTEKSMLTKFRSIFLTGNDFDFIPIGVNLYGYDFLVLSERFKHHFGTAFNADFYRNRPVIDLKPILVMMNKGIFKGYQGLLGKAESGRKVSEWYDAGDHPKIIDYITREAQNFVEKYQILKKELSKIKF